MKHLFDGKPAMALANKDSRELFVIFTGNAEGLTMDPLKFLQLTGIAKKNMLLIRDATQTCYKKGISEEYETLDGVVEFVASQIEESFPDTDVSIVGSSSGGLPAIYCGMEIKARGVWTLGARVADPVILQRRDDFLISVIKRVTGRELDAALIRLRTAIISEEEWTRIHENLDRTEGGRDFRAMVEDPKRILDLESLARLVEKVRTSSSGTPIHMHFESTNEPDRYVANAFEGLPGVRLHPVTAEPNQLPTEKFLGKTTHSVATILDKQGKLATLFSSHGE